MLIKPEHEVFREPVRVALDCPDQRLDFDTVERRQVGIEHHPMSTDLQNRLLDASQRNRENRLLVNWLLHTDVRIDAKRAKSSARPRGSLQLRGALQ